MERHHYIVRLSTEERLELEAIVKKGKGNAHKIRNAQILLHSDENGERLTVEAIARLLHCNKDTVCEALPSSGDKWFGGSPGTQETGASVHTSSV